MTTRKSLGLVIAACTLALAATAAAADMKKVSDSGWFDFESCTFCQNLGSEKGLLEHATWENHPISNGVVTIVTVPAEYAEAMTRAHDAMTAVGTRIHSGEINPMTLKMCGHCQQFGLVLMSGKMNMEEVRGQAATVTLMTSDDKATVAQLQTIAKRDNEELAKLSGNMAGHDAHEGHGH